MLDELLPVYDVDDGVAVVADAPPDACWRALLDADLLEVGRRRPVVAALGALRILPETAVRLARGEGLPDRPDRLRLLDTAQAGDWVLLRHDEEARELALGLVGRFWLPVIPYADVTAEDFTAFAEPGWAKTVYALAVHELADGGSLLRATMRTATTDEYARRWFGRYWTLGVGPGAHLLARALLADVRDAAQAAVVT